MKYLELAKKLAETSTKYPRVGCLIVKKKRVVSMGVNTCKSHPLQKRLNHLRFEDKWFDTCKHERHAEFNAVLAANESLEGSSIYIARLNKDGLEMPSMPCKACLELIRKHNIKKIIFT